MSQAAVSPFDSLESAHDFVILLALTVEEAKKELISDVDRETAGRRLDALRVALYNLDKLETHLRTSGRLLNDLRSIRRLLFQERSARGGKSTPGVLNDKTVALAAGPKNGHGAAAA